MRHHKKGRAFGREDKGRAALLRSLTVSLIQHDKITTTEARAKEIRPIVEKLITRSKNDTVAARRTVTSRVNNARTVEKLFKELGPKYSERAGGYTRISKVGVRIKDSSKMATIEFV